MTRPSSPIIKRLRTTREGLALLSFYEKSQPQTGIVKAQTNPQVLRVLCDGTSRDTLRILDHLSNALRHIRWAVFGLRRLLRRNGQVRNEVRGDLVVGRH